jgi:hypothetical protein
LRSLDHTSRQGIVSSVRLGDSRASVCSPNQRRTLPIVTKSNHDHE